jgi:hypothetical protein
VERGRVWFHVKQRATTGRRSPSPWAYPVPLVASRSGATSAPWAGTASTKPSASLQPGSRSGGSTLALTSPLPRLSASRASCASNGWRHHCSYGHPPYGRSIARHAPAASVATPPPASTSVHVHRPIPRAVLHASAPRASRLHARPACLPRRPRRFPASYLTLPFKLPRIPPALPVSPLPPRSRSLRFPRAPRSSPLPLRASRSLPLHSRSLLAPPPRPTAAFPLRVPPSSRLPFPSSRLRSPSESRAPSRAPIALRSPAVPRSPAPLRIALSAPPRRRIHPPTARRAAALDRTQPASSTPSRLLQIAFLLCVTSGTCACGCVCGGVRYLLATFPPSETHGPPRAAPARSRDLSRAPSDRPCRAALRPASGAIHAARLIPCSSSYVASSCPLGGSHELPPPSCRPDASAPRSLAKRPRTPLRPMAPPPLLLHLPGSSVPPAARHAEALPSSDCHRTQFMRMAHP